MAVYKIMLQHMNEEQKFNTMAKLCQDVLGGVTDGMINLNSPSCNDVLQVHHYAIIPPYHHAMPPYHHATSHD